MAENSFRELGDITFIQEKLGVAILTDPKFAMQISDVIESKYFNLLYVRAVIEEYFNYYKKYKLFPSIDMLVEITTKKLEIESNDTLCFMVREYLDKLKDDTITNDSDIPFVKDKSIDFCKKQKILNAMLEAQSKLNSSKYDEVATILNDALNAGGERDLGMVYDTDIQPRITELTSREAVTSGFTYLDEIIRGGFGKGELIAFIAPTGGGKTTFLINLGVNALKSGKKVVHYTLELDPNVVGLRYDSNVLGIPFDDFIYEKEVTNSVTGEVKLIKFIKEDIHKQLIEMKDKHFQKNSKLVIKQYPSRRANTNMIRNHLFKMISSDIKPDLIIVDYADLIKPSLVRTEKRFELNEIYGELRAIAVEYKCPVITASQTNRLGWDNDMVSLKEIAESFAKSNELDLALCFSRTTVDKQKGTARLMVAKNRNGREGILFPVRYYDSIFKMELLHSCTLEELPDEFKSIDKNDIKKILKQYANES